MNKNTYFSSDWHIGHEKVLEYNNRPFINLKHMHRVLINNYNNTVKPNDICYFLGDMGLTKGDEIKKVIKRLNGTKILILGNHDKKGKQFWYSAGFDLVMYGAKLYINHHEVTLSHCPLYGVKREDTSHINGSENENWHREEKHTKKGHSFPDWGQFHLHGHTHAPNNETKVALGHQYDVGVDGNSYTPVSISKIESWIALTLKGK